MHRDVALTGGAALAAGLLLGLVVDRLVRVAPVARAVRSETAPRQSDRGALLRAAVEALPSDVLERFRAAAAF